MKQVLYYEKLQKMVTVLGKWQVLSFDETAAQKYIELRKQIGQAKIGAWDLRIASIVLCHNATLLTKDSGFQHIPDLHVEDWSFGPNERP